MTKRLIAAALAVLFLLACMTGCGTSPQEDAEKQYSDVVSIELFGVESGVAYYDAYITEDFGWDKAGPTRQCTIAKMTVEDCEKLFTAKIGFPLGAEAQSMSVMGYQEDGYLTFSWDGGDSVKIYTNQSRDNEIYKFADIFE